MNKQAANHDVWSRFVHHERLTAEQAEKFLTLATMLDEWNKKFNLTAINETADIVRDHFEDSLFVRHVHDLSTCTGLVDVGTGAGFPALPLKIMFPELPMVLIEVNKKKIQFIEAVVQQLGMVDVQICDMDWRTFLRKTAYVHNFFVSRAALPPEELIRMFKPASPYKNACLVYWASQYWRSTVETAPYILKEEVYAVGSKERRLIFFSLPQASRSDAGGL